MTRSLQTPPNPANRATNLNLIFPKPAYKRPTSRGASGDQRPDDPAEVSDFPTMDIEQFWDLIEQARTAAGPAADQAVRDFDEPEDDPDRDYWDFEDIDLQQALVDRNILQSDEPDDMLDEDDDEDDEDDDEEDVTDPVAIGLLTLLAQLPAAEIASFDNLFEQLRNDAESHDMANAAVLIEHGFLGDDSFDDFRAGLVALGRATYERALADPDTLSEHPLVREIAAAHDPRWLGREDMLFVASHAYALVTGEDEVTFYDFAEDQRAEDQRAEDQRVEEARANGDPDEARAVGRANLGIGTLRGQDPRGPRPPRTDDQRTEDLRIQDPSLRGQLTVDLSAGDLRAADWGLPDADLEDEPDPDEGYWSVEDEAETRKRLPQLATLFYERSTRNRLRAMEKLGLQD
jgi:Protein of unknown function (DUF4240)